MFLQTKKGSQWLLLPLIGAMSLLLLACGGGETYTGDAQGEQPTSGQVEGEADQEGRAITVVSREGGSGTRGAFIELLGIEEKNEAGEKTDRTTAEALIANKTDVMLSQVAGNPDAIGYVSLGSLNDSVKALAVDGVAATPENVVNGAYPIVRPFLIATKGEPSGLAADFIQFILSAEGQAVVGEGYIPVDDNAPAYAGAHPSGKIVVAGSSSVTPVMEKLREAYLALHPDVTIEVQQSDSSAGLQGAIDGVCDIGMSSRELKEEEQAQLQAVQIANDGIAVIVNTANPKDGLTKDEIKDIYTGKVTTW